MIGSIEYVYGLVCRLDCLFASILQSISVLVFVLILVLAPIPILIHVIMIIITIITDKQTHQPHNLITPSQPLDAT